MPPISVNFLRFEKAPILLDIGSHLTAERNGARQRNLLAPSIVHLEHIVSIVK